MDYSLLIAVRKIESHTHDHCGDIMNLRLDEDCHHDHSHGEKEDHDHSYGEEEDHDHHSHGEKEDHHHDHDH